MKKLVVFDLDGTLIDTLGDLSESLNKTLKEFNLKTYTEDEIKNFVGYGAKVLIELAVPNASKELLDKVFDRYIEIFSKCDNSRTHLYDGLDEVLLKLKEKGFKLAIVSNKPDGLTKLVVEQKLSKYNFDFVTGNRPELFNPKPDKSCVEYCLSEMGVDKNEVVYVGDSETDVKTFLNAQVDGIGVTWGFRSKQTLKEAGAKVIADKPSELLDKLLSY